MDVPSDGSIDVPLKPPELWEGPQRWIGSPAVDGSHAVETLVNHAVETLPGRPVPPTIVRSHPQSPHYTQNRQMGVAMREAEGRIRMHGGCSARPLFQKSKIETKTKQNVATKINLKNRNA
jgi:hypothetical protein